MKKLIALLLLLVLLCLLYPDVRQSLVPPADGPEEGETSSGEAQKTEKPLETGESISAEGKDPAMAEEELPADTDFVRVRDYIPSIAVSLRYATEDNFTGEIIYDFSEAYLRYGTVKKLSAAHAALNEAGYGLLLWDAFRPVSAQFTLWEVCPDSVYVADPNRGFSSHSRGSTVDVTLITLEGEAVEMPTDFDDFTDRADRDYSDVSENAAANALLLEQVMTASGFAPYQGEWWHFSDTDAYEVEQSFSPA